MAAVRGGLRRGSAGPAVAAAAESGTPGGGVLLSAGRPPGAAPAARGGGKAVLPVLCWGVSPPCSGPSSAGSRFCWVWRRF